MRFSSLKISSLKQVMPQRLLLMMLMLIQFVPAGTRVYLCLGGDHQVEVNLLGRGENHPECAHHQECDDQEDVTCEEHECTDLHIAALEVRIPLSRVKATSALIFPVPINFVVHEMRVCEPRLITRDGFSGKGSGGDEAGLAFAIFRC